MISRTAGIRLSLAAAALAGAATLALAQSNYPERNITLIVPYGAGGGTDITARMLAQGSRSRRSASR